MHDREVKNKIRMLVQQLISNTQSGKVAWTDTGDEDAFRANMQGGMVRVQKRRYFDEEGQDNVGLSLTLLDRQGRVVEEYDPDPLAAEHELAELWNLARRSSRGTADVLDNLLKETGSEER